MRYQDHDALGLAQLVAKGEVSARELLDTALEMAERHSQLNAIVALDAQGAARAAETLEPGKPLGGVPFLLKDLYVEAEGLPLTNGCQLYSDYVSEHDSVLIERYRQAGLMIFGRTSSPELGLTTTTESILHGQTKNPWSDQHTAGGSSGGAASAVAAGIVPAAHGSDGGGSIRIPASCCGLFGLKPTRARVSMAPDKGEGWSGLSTNHAVTRSVRDSAALLDAVAGPAVGDPYCAPAPERPFLEEVGASPGALRIAATCQPFTRASTDPECKAAVEGAAALCEELGHQVEWARPEVSAEEIGTAATTVVGANVRASLEDRARLLGHELREEDVEPITWSIIRGTEEKTTADYARAVTTVHRVGSQLAHFFTDYDLLLSPTMAAPPSKLGELALTRTDGSAYMEKLAESIGFTQLMNVAGNPAMSVPLHWSDRGLPIGIQFAAAMGREGLLFRLAGQLEEARPWFDRRPT